MSGRVADRSAGGIAGLMRILRGRRRLLALAVLAGVLAQSGTLACMALGAWIVGLAIAGPTGALPPVCALLAILVLLTAAARWWQAWVSHDLAFALIEKLQLAIFDGLERTAPATVDGQRLGDLASAATADAGLMERFYAHTLADYVGAVLVPLAALLALWRIDGRLALTLLPFLLLVATVPGWLARRAAAQGREVAEQLGRLNADTVEFIHGLRELTLFGQTTAFVRRLLAGARRLGLAQQHYGARSGLEHAAVDLLGAAATLAVVAAAAALLQAGSLPPRSLPLALTLAIGALLPIAEVTRTASQLGELRAGAARIMRIVNRPPRLADDGRAPPPTRHDLTFTATDFSYDPARPVLRGLTLRLAPGEMVALAGRSGAGKSTVAHLLLRFYQPDRGTIAIGGVDIRTLPLATLRQQIAWVPQDIWLFNGSVADNIRLGRPDAGQPEVEQAARLAQAHDFIRALPDGYHTFCGDGGSRFSGGQRQRIAIARALLTGAPILLLDEASASLDSENERAFQRALGELRQSRTLLLIAHRPATLRQADRVLLLEEGRIVESGSHAALLAQNGRYAALMRDPAVQQRPPGG